MAVFSLLVSLLSVASIVGGITLKDITAPSCGLQCISTALMQSTCEAGNATCICINEELKSEIDSCVLSTCTVREALKSQKYINDACGVVSEDKTGQVWKQGLAFMIIGIAAFLLRCIERLRARIFGIDDWTIIAVACLAVPIGAIMMTLASHGLGLDMWALSPDNISSILYLFYCNEILYVITLGILKVSILFLYLRIFPQKCFCFAVYILMGLNITYSVVFSLAFIFQCTPIEGAWRSWDGEYPAKCVNINILVWSAASVNIVLDATILGLPIPILIGLTISFRRKLQVIAMFMVGAFVTLVSILRLQSLAQFATTRNITQDYAPAACWSVIEIDIGLLCACMPANRALFSRLFPRVFSSRGDPDDTHPHPLNDNYERSVPDDGVSSSQLNSTGRTKFNEPKPSKYDTQAGFTEHNEWSVDGEVTNRSDVELVTMAN